MAEFKDLLYKALQDGQDVYKAFVSITRDNLPADADSRYARLRGAGKYVCQDEADVNVYVDKVASRHIPKFTWLYGKLFEKFNVDFSGEVDIVVWGCGCGLDLLALYDVAQKQKSPHLWLNVRSITLLDRSESALKRAKDVAEVLFPMAHGKVLDSVCDFRKSETVPEQLIESLLPVPRVHLISNIVDLFPDEQQVKVFAKTIKERSCRKYRKSGETKFYYNEIFVAFSPEYKTEGVLQSRRLRVFRDEWEEKYASEFVDDSGPDRCTYSAFTYRTLKEDNHGNKLLRSIAHQMKGVKDKDNLLGIIAALARFFVRGEPVLRVYEWADLQYRKDNLWRVALVAKAASNVCPCVIKIGKFRDDNDEKKNREWAIDSLFEKCGNSYEDKKVRGRSLRMLAWDSEKSKLYSGSGDKSSEVTQAWFDCCVASPDDKMDFEQFFVIDPKGAKPLPSLDSMDEKQKGLVCSRRQKSKVRGGAGCGKTTAMLWHGVLAILRTRMPVLMACKTVTLFNHNKRRMAATLLKERPGLEYVDRNLICFRTVDDVLCKHTQNTIDDCEIKNVAAVSGRLATRMPLMGRVERR